MAAHSLLRRTLKLPDVSSNAELLHNISGLTELHYPAWHRSMTLATDAVLVTWLCVSWSFLCWRVSKKTFWLVRLQQGRIACNSVNMFGVIGGAALIVWLCYSYVLLRHSYQPTVQVLLIFLVWLSGWVAGSGSFYCIPTATPFGRSILSAKKMNCFVCGVPVLFLCNIVPMGIVFQVKYNEALSIDSFFQQGLRLLPSTAPVTSEELEQAVHVWAKFVSTWTYGALLFFTCGVWSLATALFFLVVFILLLLELRRQKLEHSTGTFAAAGMAVDPVWNETTQDNMATGTLVVTSRSMMHQDKLNAAGFFPPFRPAPSVFTASTSALFGKCLRNICASSLLAIGALALTACICLYTGFISPKAIASPDRRYFMLGHLTTQILTSVALVLGGAAVTHEIITQSLQPVLSAWVYKSSASATRSARAQAQRRSQGQPGFKVASQSIFASAARMPNTVKSHIERASASIFEINSKIPRQRLYSSTDSREAVASLGLQEQGEAQNDAARDPTVQARVRRAKSLPMNLREVSHGTHDSSLDAASHDTLQRSTVDAQILSYDEVRRLRGIPKPAQPIRVHFIREVQTTYEDVRPPPRAGRLQQPYVPSWRYPPNHIHHTPSYQLTHEQHLYN